METKMSKKQLKKRIKELEAENIMLRAMQSYPIYIYLYRDVPYNPYWQPYRFPTPYWKVDYTYPTIISQPNTTGQNVFGVDWGVASGDAVASYSWNVADGSIVQGTTQ